MPPGLFVTGTDTDVGKTYVAARLAERLRSGGRTVGVYKPACSGAEVFHGEPVWGDIEALRSAVGLPVAEDDFICPQRFLAPLAPPIAAAREGRTVDAELLISAARRWADRCDVLIVEGAGGLLCPLALPDDGPAVTVLDVAAALGYPLLIVARAGLGTVNQTLLTLAAAEARGLPIAGVVLNEIDAREPEAATNAAMIARCGGAPVLGVIPPGGELPEAVGQALVGEPARSGQLNQ
ncbi:dethiobiotin synthase [Alienimonas californiensis]|uniref:ATP-dependent dethiobiotin synthetase BioD n=1 Tax=Alienimonas californiensis TaxID=2527989 RepID=A0A517P9B0_9PLAN|nr:dethiobiotin synthase [Alienimonas californiensis]QDT15954.1 ATP-dependent dethiobiotin synthetase BioD [Alienimonas californiensis]